jgi:hypothetical protein
MSDQATRRDERDDDGGGGAFWGIVLVGVGGLWLASTLGVDVQLRGRGARAAGPRGRAPAAGLRAGARAVGWSCSACCCSSWRRSATTRPTCAACRSAIARWRHGPEDDVPSSYGHAIGELVVDLRRLDPDGAVVDVRIDHGIGDLELRLPRDPDVRVDVRVGVGEVDTTDLRDGERVDGIGARATLSNRGREPDSGTIAVNARVGIGSIEVTRWTHGNHTRRTSVVNVGFGIGFLAGAGVLLAERLGAARPGRLDRRADRAARGRRAAARSWPRRPGRQPALMAPVRERVARRRWRRRR